MENSTAMLANVILLKQLHEDEYGKRSSTNIKMSIRERENEKWKNFLMNQ